MAPAASNAPSNAAEAGRRDAVLESALLTFARHGYRKASMEEVARAARISRPGLYFLFESKEALFRAANSRALKEDLAAAERILADTGRPKPKQHNNTNNQKTKHNHRPQSQNVTGV